MIELEIIKEQIAFLHTVSQQRPLDTDEIKRLESLVRSRVLLTSNAQEAPAEENPFEGFDVDTLKKLHAQIGKSSSGN